MLIINPQFQMDLGVHCALSSCSRLGTCSRGELIAKTSSQLFVRSAILGFAKTMQTSWHIIVSELDCPPTRSAPPASLTHSQKTTITIKKVPCKVSGCEFDPSLGGTCPSCCHAVCLRCVRLRATQHAGTAIQFSMHAQWLKPRIKLHSTVKRRSAQLLLVLGLFKT